MKALKTINEKFDDAEYKRLLEAKNGLTWHDFIMKLAERSPDYKTPSGKEAP